MRAAVFIPIALLLLTACAKALSDAAPLGPELVKEYSPAFLAQAADELEALPPDSALAVMIADYQVLRAQLRAAE